MPASQFTSREIRRELLKAVTGFEGIEMFAGQNQPICTGRWGCGAFKGDIYLKFVIQWIACTVAHRKMIYKAQDEQEEK